MNEISKVLGDAFVEAVRLAEREEIQAAMGRDGHQPELHTAEELAESLKVPLTWVYEQSRLGKIPTHKLGRYIRFDLHKVLASQKKD